MKKIYRIIMSRGQDFIFEETITRMLMSAEGQIIEIPLEKRSVWINKAHVVCVFLDKEETAYEKQKEIEPNLPPVEEQISIDRIVELRKKAQELTNKKST